MSTDSRKYRKEYHKKYYQENKKEINDKKNISNGIRSKLMTVIYRYWRQGKFVLIDSTEQETLDSQLSAITDIKAKNKDIKG